MATYVSSLGCPSEEVEGEWTAKVKVQPSENEHLHLTDLGAGEGVVRDVGEVSNLGGKHLLVFGGQQHGRHPHQLQLPPGHWLNLQEQEVIPSFPIRTPACLRLYA